MIQIDVTFKKLLPELHMCVSFDFAQTSQNNIAESISCFSVTLQL